MALIIAIVCILVLMTAFWLVGAVMSLVWTLLIGFLAGAIAKAIMPGKDDGGFLMTAALGIAGSLTAGLLSRVFGLPGQGGGFIASIVGAIILLAAYRFFVKEESTSLTK